MQIRRATVLLAAVTCLSLSACGGSTAKSAGINACIGMRMVSSLLSSGSTGIAEGVTNARTSAATAAERDTEAYGQLNVLIQQFPTTVNAIDAAAAESKMRAIAAECMATGYVWS
ncbi:MAG: hypothetical protein PHU75_06555 [Candidatus Nanopelagicales bacterium]|nr:hypothetical protein [Candidatus Nanopelagicales bacterium]